MAVGAETIETYDNSLIREDLAEQYAMISPEEVPFQSAIGDLTATATFHEWSIVDLAAPQGDNRVVEGDDAPALDTGTLGLRLGNYTQISDKNISVSHTSEAVDAAAENIQKLSMQMTLKIRELKRDMELMLLQNVAASAGASTVARVMAGFVAWLRTNTESESGGQDPTLSGTDSGFPDAAAVEGTTQIVFDETKFNNVLTDAWEAGGAPTMALVNANNKRILSETFTGSSTRYKDAIDKTLVNAIDIYDSDFGRISIVPTRFMQSMNFGTDDDSFVVPIIDPAFAAIAWLEKMKQKPLGETGHSRKRLLRCEYTLHVHNEAAHGILRDTTNLPPV